MKQLLIVLLFLSSVVGFSQDTIRQTYNIGRIDIIPVTDKNSIQTFKVGDGWTEMALCTFSCFIINTWAMAILAILLLGVGTFGIIAGIVSHNLFWIWVSAIGFLIGVIIGLKRLNKEDVL